MVAVGKIFTKLNNALGTKVGQISLKALGFGALGLVAYDSHCLGKINADSFSKLKEGESMKDAYMRTLSTDGASTIQSKLKNEVMELESDSKAGTVFNRIRGYVLGFGTMLVDAAVPTALGIGTVATKGAARKIFGGATALYGVYALCRDVLGLGNRDDLGKYI